MNNIIKRLMSFLIDEDPDMNEILANRDKYIGGSDLPKIMGNGNWYKIAQEKINPTFEGNEYTYYGQFMEPKLRSYINQQYDYNFQPHTAYDGIYRGNCDGIDYNAKKILEIKTYGSELDVRYYMHQIQAYLHLFNVKTCILVGYKRPHNFFMWGDITNPQSYNLEFDENRVDIYHLWRDANQWKKINKKATNFFKGLDALRNDLSIDERHFNTICYGKQLIDTLDKWQNPKKLEKLLMEQDIFNAQIGAYSIKRTDITKFGVDVERLSQEMPDVFEQYKTINTTTKIEIRRKRNVTN